MRAIRFSTFLLLAACALIVFLAHLPYLKLPYFWDELGQFVPAALDILRDGAWIPHSTVPNAHPPGVMAYLALVWRMVGYSIAATRLAMLALAAAGVMLTFFLARELSRSWTAAALAALFLTARSALLHTIDDGAARHARHAVHRAGAAVVSDRSACRRGRGFAPRWCFPRKPARSCL